MKKNNLDEAQEQKLLKIEHTAYGIAFWGLLAVLLLETALEPGNMKLLAGEWIVFMTMCIYLIAACLKNGIWDRRLKPNRKTNVTASLIAGLALGSFWGISSYYNYRSLSGSLATGVISGLSTFTMAYIALAFTARLYKKRVEKMEADLDD